MPKLDLRASTRIKLPTTGLIRQMKGVGFAWPDSGAVAPPSGPAEWFTPAAPFLITPASPEQYYQASLAWSYRHNAGQINYPRPTNKMIDNPRGSFLDIQDGDDTAGRQFIAQVLDWGWVGTYLTQLVTGYIKPAQTHNFVMLFDEAGGLSGGNTVQIWCNETLVSSTSYAFASVDISSMRLLGTGSTLLPGETQGYWFSADTALDPADLFAELFDGSNGMRDLSDTTIAGVVPDAVQIGPP